MAVKILITLDGAEKVESQLKQLGATGEQAMAQISKAMPEIDLKLPGVDSKPIQDLTEHTTKLSEAFRILKPVMSAAGLQVGEFGALARVASISVTALAASAAGAVIVGLAKLEENTKRTKGQLSDLFGGQAKGEQAFAALNEQAKKFGTSVSSLVPGLEAYQRALDATATTAKGFVAASGRAEDLPGASPQDLKTVTESYSNFIKILRAGRINQDDAEKSAKAFFETFKDGGPITVAALQSLPTGTIQLLATALGRAGTSTKTFFEEVRAGNITMKDINTALANFGAQATTAFNTKAVKEMGDELKRLLAVLNEGFTKLASIGFSDFVIKNLERVRKGIQDTITEYDKLSRIIERIQAMRAAALPPSVNKLFDRLQSGGGPFGGTTEQLEKIWENAGAQSADLYRKGFVNAPALGDINKTLNDKIFKTAPEAAPGGVSEATKKLAAKVKEDFESAFTTIGNEWDQVVEGFTFEPPVFNFAALTQSFQVEKNNVEQEAQSLWDRVKQILSQPISMNISTPGSFESGGAPFARGGMVRGAGSSTSDSILAFLSNREFVVNAKAVSHYGADLFAALNSMRLPRDFINRFNMGGMVRAMSGNHFASGGMVTAGTPVILNIDRQSFAMSAGGDTIDRLKRYAVASQLSSTGRKPRWVK